MKAQAQAPRRTIAAGAGLLLIAGVFAYAGPAAAGPARPDVDVQASADTERPTTPGQPACGEVGFDSLTLTFEGSTDNVGVVAYDIYKDGQKIAEAPSPPGSPYRLTGLNPNTRYLLSVFGRDAAGNVSDSSPEADCTTTADPGDPTPSGWRTPTVRCSWPRFVASGCGGSRWTARTSAP
jgi:hypothetical protein